MKNRLKLGSTQVMKISLNKTKAALRSLRVFLRASSVPSTYSALLSTLLCADSIEQV